MLKRTTLQCETMILVGDLSPSLDEAVEANSRLDPSKTNFVKVVINLVYGTYLVSYLSNSYAIHAEKNGS